MLTNVLAYMLTPAVWVGAGFVAPVAVAAGAAAVAEYNELLTRHNDADSFIEEIADVLHNWNMYLDEVFTTVYPVGWQEGSWLPDFPVVKEVDTFVDDDLLAVGAMAGAAGGAVNMLGFKFADSREVFIATACVAYYAQLLSCDVQLPDNWSPVAMYTAISMVMSNEDERRIYTNAVSSLQQNKNAILHLPRPLGMWNVLRTGEIFKWRTFLRHEKLRVQATDAQTLVVFSEPYSKKLPEAVVDNAIDDTDAYIIPIANEVESAATTVATAQVASTTADLSGGVRGRDWDQAK